jgi:hypothetical protein
MIERRFSEEGDLLLNILSDYFESQLERYFIRSSIPTDKNEKKVKSTPPLHLVKEMKLS